MDKKRCIIHFPFYIDEKFPSGSNIRPIEFMKAFKDIGYDVDVIMGYGKERKEAIKKIKDNIRNGVKYSFVYSESSTEPTILTEKNHIPKYAFLDFDFFKFCKKNGLKIGLFYRDIYWVFDEYKNRVPLHKRYPAVACYKYDLKMYNKFVDVLYLPSMKMYEYIPFDFTGSIAELPPATEIDKVNELNNINIHNKNILKIFYVGGISNLYNIQKLFQAVKEKKYVELTVCCRKNEWENEKHIYEKYLCDRINIVHKSGDELIPYFEEADLFSLFFEPNEYRKFSMPVKLFQYLGYAKPIISTSGTATGDFIKKYDIGWELDYSTEELLNLFDKIYDNKLCLDNKIKNIKAIIKDNTWKARANQVEKDLSI